MTPKISGAPKWAYVSKVEPSKFAEGTVYVTFDGHRMGDYGSYLYASTDYGASFRSIAGNLPAGQVVRSITEDTKNADVLYVGTEAGLFVSTDRGRSWVRIKANLPTVPVYEVTIHPRDNAMILATHGRALWVLDDLTPVQQYAAAQAKDAHLFASAPAIDRIPGEDRMREFEGDLKFLGENPAPGARISYYLKTKADSARLVVKDPAGATIRELKGDAFKDRLGAGVNSVVWDLRVEPLPPSKRATGGGPLGNFFGNGRDGPVVLPGTYGLALVVNGKEAATGSVEVKTDPEVTVTAAELKERFDALKELQGMNGRVTAATDAIRDADEQFGAIRKALSDSAKVPAAIRASMDSLKKELDGVKRKLGIRSPGEDPFSVDFAELRRALPIRLTMTSGDIGGAHAGLSETNRQTLEALRKDLPGVIGEANGFLAKLKPFYQQVAAAGLYPAAPDPVK